MERDSTYTSGTSASTALQSAVNHADYQAFVDTLPVPVFTLDQNRRVATINKRAAELTGWKPEEVVGRMCNEIMQGEPCPACTAADTHKPQQHVLTDITHPDGGKKAMFVDAMPMGTGVAVILREDRMREALRKTGGCVTRAARLLGIHRTTLWRRMREGGLDRGEFLQG